MPDLGRAYGLDPQSTGPAIIAPGSFYKEALQKVFGAKTKGRRLNQLITDLATKLETPFAFSALREAFLSHMT